MKTMPVILTLAAWTAVVAFAQTPHGFLDIRAGARIADDPRQDDASLAETRLQLEWMNYAGPASLQLRADALADALRDDHGIDLETGEGAVDLREAYILFSPTLFMDVKLGRQILTWGTGDLLFINDLFPKDWPSFFTGRDEEYLKAPSDTALVSLFSDWINLDMAYTPKFDADRYITGERISYWSDALGRRAGEDDSFSTETPNEWFEADEAALRLTRLTGRYEWAAYGYDGYWKSPAGMNPETGSARFPELRVYGASVRGPAGGGIANLEVGYYDSTEDDDGSNPFVRNSEIRWLAGYQRELARNLNGSVQYYLERMRDHDNYRTALPEGSTEADENRHVLTLRLTRQLWSQNLTLSIFGYYSPSDRDAYVRPKASYKLDDHWRITGGSNLFYGQSPDTFFGQFEKNNNVYAGLRYSF